MPKTISIIGGTGYVGTRCIETLLRQVKDVKVYAIARNVRLDMLNRFDDRVQYVKANALDPSSFSEYIEKSDGIIHTVGKLIATSEDKNESYQSINYEAAINVARIANNLSKDENKKNFVYISAERGLAFPLSIFFSGYIESKRKAEDELLRDYPKLNINILRPGLINDMKERPYLLPVSYAFDFNHFLEKNVLDKVSPGLGATCNLPPGSIELDTLAVYCNAGGLGKLEANRIYSNDYMNDLKNLPNLNNLV